MSALTTIDAALAADVRGRVEAVRQRIEAAARRGGRDPADVTLVGVSKRQPPERVAAAVAAGVRELGENYVQEAIAKIPEVHGLLSGERPRWRMIGGLQRNKARAAVEWFSLVETVDRESLARTLDQRVRDADRSEPLPIFLQVNLSHEPQKSGAARDALAPLLAACRGLSHVRVSGLMTVPAASPDPEQSRPAFAELRALRDALREKPGGEHLVELSMGMSADFEVAIEEGATCVRVGTAIFGPRPDPGAPE